MVVITKISSCKLGESDTDNEEIANRIIFMRWRRVPNIAPQTVMNTVTPIGWHQAHKWVEIEIHALSECYHAFYHNGTTNKAYIVEGDDNLEIPYFVAIGKDKNSQDWTATFTDAIPLGPIETYQDGKDTIIVYGLLAKKVDITPPP